MTTETALVTSSVDPDISAAMVVYERLRPLQDALGLRDLTVPEMQLFAMVAHHTGLDPFTRQIYAIKRGGKVTHQTGIDGYRSVAEGTHEYAGSDEATYETCDCGKDPKNHPAIARVVVHRILPSGHIVDQVGVARWHELVPPSGQDQMWMKMPWNQLAKCAEANGLRKAFPRVLGGVYIAEEMQAETIDGQAQDVTSRPSVAERVAQRRAQIERPPEPATEPEPIEGSFTVEVPEPTVQSQAAERVVQHRAERVEGMQAQSISPAEFATWLNAQQVPSDVLRATVKAVDPAAKTFAELTDEGRGELRRRLG
jgi:phage recombination protein Bet